MEGEKQIKFSGGRNIALKVPPHEWSATVEFYRDIIRLKEVKELAPDVVFEFGSCRLWIDKVDQLSQAELWLELSVSNAAEAAKYLASRDVVRRDEIENLPAGFKGFWIQNPASIIHLIAEDS